jgi:glycine/D-amino acid oxidase-like deaminating enzyme
MLGRQVGSSDWFVRNVWRFPTRQNMQTADIVIVGRGTVGSSIACHLAASGCRNLPVIEREPAQGKGSTGKSTGSVRARFSPPVSFQMSHYSIPFCAKFEADLGCPCDDYLFCAAAQNQMAYLRDKLHPASEDGSEGCSAADEVRGAMQSWLSLSRFAEGRLIQENGCAVSVHSFCKGAA